MTLNKLCIFITLTGLLLLSACEKKPENLIKYVNPMIGTGPSSGPESVKKSQNYDRWGLAIPAVSMPAGMIQWTPQTRDGEKAGSSPYYYGGQKIQGFRGTHWLSSSQTKDYGSFTIMPITGYLKTFAIERASTFEHKIESSSPAYYSCFLLYYLTYVEITGTTRAGFFKFTFAENEPATILINPNSDEGKGYIKIDPDRNEIYGYNPATKINQDTTQAATFNGYFVMRFARRFDKYGCYFRMENLRNQLEISGKPDIGAYATFNVEKEKVILAKVGTSFSSIEEARANLDAEIQDWDFNKTKVEAEKVWNDVLSAVQIKGGKHEDYGMFYTALYRALLYPRTFSDVDGSYPAFQANQPKRKMEAGHVYYDDFVLSAETQPQLSLLRLIAPERYEDLLLSAKLKSTNGGWMTESCSANRPDPYTYSNLTDPVERQRGVKEILREEYNPFDGGIPGNDNAGQKSAWYVWSAMGLYPSKVNPDEYLISSPVFSDVKLNLNEKFYPGKSFKIINDEKETYKTTNRVELNGDKKQLVMKHEELVKGGKLEFSNKN
jgi:putative alpha-1,2-mannosidase